MFYKNENKNLGLTCSLRLYWILQKFNNYRKFPDKIPRVSNKPRMFFWGILYGDGYTIWGVLYKGDILTSKYMYRNTNHPRKRPKKRPISYPNMVSKMFSVELSLTQLNLQIIPVHILINWIPPHPLLHTPDFPFKSAFTSWYWEWPDIAFNLAWQKLLVYRLLLIKNNCCNFMTVLILRYLI